MKIVSLNPDIFWFPESGSKDAPGAKDIQRYQVYRAITTWFVAAQMEHGHVHVTAESLQRAQEFLAACDESPSFAVETYDDGCTSVTLIQNAPKPDAP